MCELEPKGVCVVSTFGRRASGISCDSFSTQQSCCSHLMSFKAAVWNSVNVERDVDGLQSTKQLIESQEEDIFISDGRNIQIL